MTMTWALDPDRNDLVIENGKLNTVTGADEVVQRVLVALGHFWEEYFLDTPAGVPWYELLLGSKDKKLIDVVLRKVILEVPGVLSIISIRVKTVSRAVEVSFAVQAAGLLGSSFVSGAYLQDSV